MLLWALFELGSLSLHFPLPLVPFLEYVAGIIVYFCSPMSLCQFSFQWPLGLWFLRDLLSCPSTETASSLGEGSYSVFLLATSNSPQLPSLGWSSRVFFLMNFHMSFRTQLRRHSDYKSFLWWNYCCFHCAVLAFSTKTTTSLYYS